jgi:hypothetical protein
MPSFHHDAFEDLI